jgi:large subunit ribosomal protein L24
MKFKKGDEIQITGGKDRGKKGKIDKVMPQLDTVLVPGLNMYKRHMKKRDEKNQGGIIDFPRPIPVGRIALICPKCKKLTRAGYSGNGKDKNRICRKCKQLI